MNKHSMITIIAIVIIVIPFIHSGSNILGVQQLEYRWDNPGKFSFFTMSNHGEIEFCNTIPFWVSFEKFKIETFYQSKSLGSFSVNPSTINPLSSTIQEGIFSTDQMSAAQHIFMIFDFEFDGGNIRLDPNQFIILTSLDTTILGIIPYSTTTQISGLELDEIMNNQNLTCN